MRFLFRPSIPDLASRQEHRWPLAPLPGRVNGTSFPSSGLGTHFCEAPLRNAFAVDSTPTGRATFEGGQ
jgi:hypothetical protein